MVSRARARTHTHTHTHTCDTGEGEEDDEDFLKRYATTEEEQEPTHELLPWSSQKEGRRGEQHPTPTSDLQVRITYSLLTINCAWPNKHTHSHTNTHITSQSLAGESAAV